MTFRAHYRSVRLVEPETRYIWWGIRKNIAGESSLQLKYPQPNLRFNALRSNCQRKLNVSSGSSSFNPWATCPRRK